MVAHLIAAGVCRAAEGERCTTPGTARLGAAGTMIGNMANIVIGPEREGANHWAYEVTVRDGEVEHRFAVTLGWSDYDLWSHGRAPPSRVVEAAFEFLLQRESAAEILRKFDCSVIRRYFPQVDAELPKRV